MPDPESRPDPDRLLSLLQKEEGRNLGGRLRVFLGMAPGVGKTYAMLEAAHAKAAEGVDTAIGLVETHNRAETEALLEGLPVLPRRKVEYKGHELEEFDLDGALARRPALIIVDELAHSNAPGSRHDKRWQDVEDLLGHGIDVWTAMNVQHLDSLNDVVMQITGVRVAETVPDSLLEAAESVMLVDLTPEDLQQRLREGKVYIPKRAETAMANFFRPGNLIALREIALRATAQRVNAEVIAYRSNRDIRAIWPTSERILVCVGPSPSSANLVRAAKRLATGLQAPWLALFIHGVITDKEHDRAFRNLELAEELGAETHVLLGKNVPQEVIDFARRHNATKILVGKPMRRSWRDYLYGSPVDKIILLSGEIDIYVIRGDGGSEPQQKAVTGGVRVPWLHYGMASALIAACTAVNFAIRPYVGASDIVMIYLLGVIASALWLRRGAAAFASVASVLAFNFCFVSPHFSFAMSDLHNIVTFFVMLATALLMSSMAWQLRRQADNAGAMEWQSSAFAGLTRKLLSAHNAGEIYLAAHEHMRKIFGFRVCFLVPDGKGGLTAAPGPPGSLAINAKQLSIAAWTLNNGNPAGWESQNLPDSRVRFVPLKAAGETLGVMALEAESPEAAEAAKTPDRRRLLEMFVGEIAKALANHADPV